MSDFVTADHYSKVPPSEWPWPDFSPAEVASRGDGSIRVSRELMSKLQALRTALNCPLILNSIYRDPTHNRKIGGAKDSYHMKGLAADVSMANHDPSEFETAARKAGFTGFGFYPPKKGNFIHLDIGPARSWGTRWTAPKFQPETKKVLPTGGGRALGTLGVGGVVTGVAEAVKPDNLTAIQQAIQPMLPYAPILQGVFAACGFGVVGWMLWAKFGRTAQ
jgi:zinc D-Ala-D-Ala carboxypeptidase